MINSKTARFSLPLLAAGQAHKELQHNEALTLLDFLIHPVAKSILDDPTTLTPEAGDCWIVGNSPVEEWAGRQSQIANWSEGGWRFIMPEVQMAVFLADMDVKVSFVNGSWSSGIAVAAPSGGQVVDTEARMAIESVVEALQSSGILLQS